MSGYFNPRPPRGGRRPASCSLRLRRCNFNPRPPRGGATDIGIPHVATWLFQSTPPRGGRQLSTLNLPSLITISIHAPREGGRLLRCVKRSAIPNFNPRPREGGDLDATSSSSTVYISIHAPREGGDHRREWRSICHRHFNPRPPRGGRRYGRSLHRQRAGISIHAPREGGDLRPTFRSCSCL